MSDCKAQRILCVLSRNEGWQTGKGHGSRTQKVEAMKKDEKWSREEQWCGLGMGLEAGNIRDLGTDST